MHANGNQIMEGKVLDEQVKIRIFEAFRQSCFLFDETSGQCAYMGSVRKCDGKCRLMLRFKQNLDKLFLLKRNCSHWLNLIDKFNIADRKIY